MTNKVELNTLTQVVHKEQAFLTALNENFLRLQQAINDTLSRSGVTPNEMQEVLDMNGKRITNVGTAVDPKDALTKEFIDDVVAEVEAAADRWNSLVNDAQQALEIYAAEHIYPVAQAAVDSAKDYAEDAKDYYEDTKDLYDALADIRDNMAGLLSVISNMTEILAVEADLSNIDTVASNVSDISTVATNISDVSTVADAATDISSVAGDLTNIDNVAGDLTNINSVAGDLTNINNVAGDLTNIDSVEDHLTNIDTLAALSGQITIISENISGILAASTYAEYAGIWAEGSDADVAALGGTHSAKGWAQVAEEAAGGYSAGDGISISASKEISTTTQAHSKLVNAVVSAEYEIEVSDWDAVTKEATVSVTDLHTTSTVWIAPKPTAANIEAYTDAKIFGSSVAEGALTLTCDTIPSGSVYVIIGVC